MSEQMKTTPFEERRAQIEATRAEAERELEDLATRRRALAPEVLSGDEAARAEFEEATQGMAEATGRAELAAAALSELEAREEEERRREEEERQEGLRAEYDALAERRVPVEERAQEAVEALVTVLDELEGIDFEQRELSHEIGEGLNQYRIDTSFIVGNWLESRLAAHMPGATPVSDFLKPLPELNPLERRAPRPAELAEVRERNEREIAERAEEERQEREDREHRQSITERYESLMGRFLEEDSDVRRRHESEFVLPTLEREYGVEEVRTVLRLERQRPTSAAAPEGG